ncbi:MAG: hypothetical protein R3F14_43150 [Polyangiaceae bacterium]
MPSTLHNVVTEVVKAHPEVLEYLLALAGSPPGGPLHVTTDTQARTISVERRVDVAFLVGSTKRPSSFLLVEVQLDPDENKRFEWPFYLELWRSRHRCEGAVVVLTIADRVRRWIDSVIVPASGVHGTSRQMRPTVVALDQIAPALLLRSELPYLAPLVVAGHIHAPDAPEIAERALDLTVATLPLRLARPQLDAIFGMANAALHARLKRRLMDNPTYRSALFRSIAEEASVEARAEGKAEGLAEGKAEGLAEGKAEGLAEGKAEGLAEGMAAAAAKSLFSVFAARNLPVSAAVKERIESCTDIALLDLWIQRAVTAKTARAAIASPRTQRPPAKAPSAAKQATSRGTSSKPRSPSAKKK